MQRTLRLLFVSALVGAGVAASVGPAHSAMPAVAPTIPSVGGQEPAITTEGAAGDYLRGVHGRLHGRWTENFVKTVAATYPATHPLNVVTRQITVALTIRWDGSLAEAIVRKTSGSPEFDRAALDVARKSAPFPLPPSDVISDDSYAHVEWTFARDHRACGAGARIDRVDDPLTLSLPRLIRGNRVGEALRRVGQATKDDGDAGLDRFARLYLSRTVPDPILNVAASVALAEAGDRSQAAHLRDALTSRATVEMAAHALQKLGVDICEAVRESAAGGTPLAREIAIVAIRTSATAGADIGNCRDSLATIVADEKLPRALRLSALDTMVTFAPAAARPVVASAMLDKDPGVRGAATLASVRKGAGRPEMYRLAPMLHDKAVEIRGAASAGMVRAAGDTALDQLYLLARETDPRPAQWVAAELAQLATPASAQFLGRMLKKNNFQVQVAAARALSVRKDAAARAELDAVKADAQVPGEVRTIAMGQAKAEPGAGPGQGGATTQAVAATVPVRQLLKDSRNHEAASWIVGNLLSLEPRDAIDVLGAWLLRPPPAAAEGAKATPASPPQTEAPVSSTPNINALAM